MTPEEKNTDRFEFYIYPREVDATKRISLANLGSYILDAAGLAAAKRDFGMNTLHARGMAWVVSRMTMEITEMPTEYETIYITTWIEKVNPIASMRNFLVHNTDGRLLAKATTLWSVIDFGTRKLVNLLEATNLSGLIAEHAGSQEPMPQPARVDINNSLEAELFGHRVVYSDIDMNRHTSSMRYLQWALNTLPIEQLCTTPIVRLDMNFTKEALYGETIAVARRKKENTLLFDMRNQEKQCCCKIRLTFGEQKTTKSEQGTTI